MRMVSYAELSRRVQSLDNHQIKKKDIKSRDMKRLSIYRDYLRSKPDLRVLFFELTDRCNLRCRHCGSSCEPSNANYADTAALLRLLSEINRDFPDPDFMICLTGGEPLLHPDFEVIANAVNNAGLPWGMTTNAVLIDETAANKLRELKMTGISVSMDGLKDTHEWLRGVPGCYDRTVSGINNLHEAGHSVQVTTVVGRHNYNQLEEMYRNIRSLNVASWRVVNMEPIGRANTDIPNMALDRNEIMGLIRFIREKRYDPENPMDVCYGCSHYLSFDYEREVRDNYFHCMSGTGVASILVNGDIYGCLDIERRPELVQGNINTDRFYDVWMHRFEPYRIDRSTLCDECSNCDERRFCGGDSMHTWDFDVNRPRICLLHGKEA